MELSFGERAPMSRKRSPGSLGWTMSVSAGGEGEQSGTEAGWSLFGQLGGTTRRGDIMAVYSSRR